MDIVIVSQYLRDIENFEENNSRFVYLAKLLCRDTNNHVEIITSDFNHARKKRFNSIDKLESVKITALHESGYPKNVCLKRFVSHKELARNVHDYLLKRNKPDVCYCAVPSLDVADIVADYCKRNNVRFIIDIQDLWPEAFKMVFHVPIISNLIFAQMKKQADRIYRSADHIVAVSKTYAGRAVAVNKKCDRPIVVYLGTDREDFNKYSDGKYEKKEKVLIGYVGSMSESYDLRTIIDAIAKINEHDIKLLAMGDGTLKNTFAAYSEEKGINAEFTGKLSYPQMAELLKQCDFAVNPIRRGSAGSIINKVGDYAMAGLPVVNTQECPEYRNLLEQYNAGINCKCEDSDEVSTAILRLSEDLELRKEMSRNSRKLGIEMFDRGNSYRRIVDSMMQNSKKKGGGNTPCLLWDTRTQL